MAFSRLSGLIRAEAINRSIHNSVTNLLTASERAKLDQNDDVLNGIAYNEKKGTIYVTGKHWPKLFEIKTF